MSLEQLKQELYLNYDKKKIFQDIIYLIFLIYIIKITYYKMN